MKTVFILFSLVSFYSCASSQFEQVATIGSEKLSEASGMDFSRVHKDVFWTHNDSADTPVLYALGTNGKKVAEFVIKTEVGDWEDISVAKCLESEGDCLYIADTGNKRGKRKQLNILVIEEPKVLSNDILDVKKVLTFKSQGENFESLAFDENRHQFYLLNKLGRRFDPIDQKKSRVSLFVLDPVELKLKKSALFDFALVPNLDNQDTLVTAADFDAGRDTLLIGTYGKAFEIKVGDFNAFATAVNVLELPNLEKAEAMSYNGNDIFVTSEGKNPPLYQLSR